MRADAWRLEMIDKIRGLTQLFGRDLVLEAEFFLKFGSDWPTIPINTPAKPLNDAQIGGFFLPAAFVR